MRCFVDTGAFVALYNRNDNLHPAARSIWERLRREDASLATTRDVVSETITLMRRRAGTDLALRCGEDLWTSPVLEVVRPGPEHDRLAWELFRKFADQDLSYADCVSFAVMRGLRILKAFAFDRHFETAGFEVLRPD